MIAGALAATSAVAQHKDEPAPKSIPRAQFIASMDAEFGKMDVDRDGQATPAEIEQFERARLESDARARNRAQFAELDTNKNGQLSAAEFARLVPPVIASAQPTLARMDGNRDRQLSLIEYRAATLANFDRLDRNRDGLVTPAEMNAGGVAPR